MLNGIHTYDPTRGMRLSSGVYENVLYAIRKEARRQAEWTVHETPLPQEPAARGKRPEATVADSEFLTTVMYRLSDREQRIFKALMSGKTQKEVAREEGATQGAICKTRRKVLKRLGYKYPLGNVRRGDGSVASFGIKRDNALFCVLRRFLNTIDHLINKATKRR